MTIEIWIAFVSAIGLAAWLIRAFCYDNRYLRFLLERTVQAAGATVLLLALVHAFVMK